MENMIKKSEIINIILESKDKLDAISRIQNWSRPKGSWIHEKRTDYLGDVDYYYHCSNCGAVYSYTPEICSRCNSYNPIVESV